MFSHLVKEVPNFKKFIEDDIAVRENALVAHIKAQQFKIYIDAVGYSIMKYKLLYMDKQWLSQDGEIKL